MSVDLSGRLASIPSAWRRVPAGLQREGYSAARVECYGDPQHLTKPPKTPQNRRDFNDEVELKIQVTACGEGMRQAHCVRRARRTEDAR